MITKEKREELLKQKGLVLWFTGLSGAGKSTIAEALSEELHEMKKLCYVLDGDVLRTGLNSDLGLTPEDRDENIRRTYQVASLFADAGVIVICATISPYTKARRDAREKAGDGFVEVFINCPVSECILRDPKGLYKRFNNGEFLGMTGIDAPYQIPENPELILNTHENDVESCVKKIIEYIF